jgi:hypothetical protein
VPHIFTIRLLVRSALISAVTQLHAQHYPTGVQGIKAGSLPGPGFTVEDDNSFYFADRLPGFNGTFDYRDSGFSTFSYVQAPRLTWMSSWKMLGANYGAAIRVPVEFKETKFIVEPLTGPVHLKSDQFGLADIEVQPVLLAWHLKHFDFSTGYSFWAPTGDYDQNRFFAENIGDGYWTHSFMLGVTWYPDSDKTWAISVLNHYDINTRQYSTLEYVPPTQSNPLGIGSFDTTLGDIYSLEWSVSKTIDHFDLGLTGYYQQQITDTQNPGPNGPTWKGEHLHIAGIGPEIGYTIPKWGLSASLRYAYEFSALDHTQGNLINLTIKKTF